MVFGRKQEASDEGTAPLKHPNPPCRRSTDMFRQVTDVTWDPAGNTYISDGYINSRVAKVDKNGKWLKSWGEPGEVRANSTRRTASPPTRKATSTSPIAATAAFRCSIRRQVSPANQDRRAVRSAERAAGDRQQAKVRTRPARCLPARPGRSASRRGQNSSVQLRRLSGPRLQADAGRKSPWRAWASPASSSSNSDGFTKSLARPRTSFTSPRS